MKTFGRHVVATLGGLILLSFSSAIHATPISADITGVALIHTGSNPAGTGDPDDWLNFDPGQSLNLDYDATGNLLSLIAPQTFSMSSNNGATDVLELLSFDMDLNDTDGFLGGSVDYILGGVMGTFSLLNENYTSIYNTSSITNGTLSLSIWGGDDVNDLGLDMTIHADIPEPGVVTLLLIGLVAMRYSLGKHARS